MTDSSTDPDTHHQRLIIASNRLPFTLERRGEAIHSTPSPGGLVTALDPVLRRRGGTWIGWPGISLRPGESLPDTGCPYRVRTVEPQARDLDLYLNGFANGTLWPLFHSLPDRTRFDRGEFHAFERVNELFAEAIVDEVDADTLVWIHDYQLILTPDLVRAVRPDSRLAFFLHIPFPPYDVFRLLPWEEEVLRSLLACDLIGFHVRGYARNFLECCERGLGARVDYENMVVQHGNRAVRVGAFPIGIEFEAFDERARKAPAHPGGRREQIVLGVDRLDYTKGIPERIMAFERLLELHPEHREHAVLLQLAVPSRSSVSEYQDLKREIDELVGQVNGRFATATWSPIRYLYRVLTHEELASIYRDACVALVTPLRDGMNLVAKEYVASQVDEPGVLILSKLAGAAETMREALQVNPYDIDQTAESIHRALSMEEPERRARVAALRKRERRDSVHAWVERYLDAAERMQVADIAPVSPQEIEQWFAPYLTRPRIALFLDYDGTLAEIVPHPADAKMSAGMRAALDACASRADTDVVIVSGRALDDVKEIVGDERFVYAGNHGLEISGPGIERFRHEDLSHYEARTGALADALESVSGDGAWVERKGPTLTFHFRQMSISAGRERAARARQIITSQGFQARPAHMAVEARPPIGWDKGRAVLHVLRARFGPSWPDEVRPVYLGDDQTDEDAFRFLGGLAVTFRVGPADTPTAAGRRVPDVATVQRLLEWLGQRAEFEPATP